MGYIYKCANHIYVHQDSTKPIRLAPAVFEYWEKKPPPKDLRVIYGYHGVPNTGGYSHDFDEKEIKLCRQMAKKFVTLKPVERMYKGEKGGGLTDEEIVKCVVEGNVFFTWCWSAIRVGKAVRKVEKKRGDLLKEEGVIITVK